MENLDKLCDENLLNENKKLKKIIAILASLGIVVIIGGVVYIDHKLNTSFSDGFRKGAIKGVEIGRDSVIETLLKCDGRSDLLKFLLKNNILVKRLGMP